MSSQHAVMILVTCLLLFSNYVITCNNVHSKHRISSGFQEFLRDSSIRQDFLKNSSRVFKDSSGKLFRNASGNFSRITSGVHS